ncbi:TPA: restriction endonuclease subunit S [Corynebacterium striatum]|nr:restriction endonuclease subunit S [Corynebacterium striatum]
MSISRHHEAKQWLKNLPSGWRIVTVKQCAEITYGFPADSESFTTDPDYIPLIRIRDITSGNIQTYYSGTYPRESLINDEDVLIGMDGDFNLRVWAGGQALLNQRCCRVAGNTPEVTKFLSYTLPYALTEIHNLTLSTTVKHLLADGIEKALLPLPDSTEELRAIVSVLDAETFKIDRAVDLLRQQLEALELIKKSLIYEAVTKGIDPSVRMKPSAVEWIGDIPEHWHIDRISNVTTRVGSGKTPLGGADTYVDEGIPLIRSQNIFDGELHLDDAVRIDELTELSMIATRVRPGDVLLNITGASIGRSCVVPESIGIANVNQHVCVIRPDLTSIDSTFLHYLWSTLGQEWVFRNQNGATREALTFREIRAATFPVPSISTQRRIVEKVQKDLLALNQTLSIKRQQLSLLNEQRRSLIFEYV